MDITLVITSCGRFELLQKTVESIQQSIDISAYPKILSEDSQDIKHISRMQEAEEV
jgi:hypothetical protein